MHRSCPPPESPLRGLFQEEFAAWAGFLQAHAALARGLDADLRAAHGLPLSEFEVLLWLARRPCCQMRMSALADSVLLSPSGVSRAVERLEARGLVRRDRSAEDRRGYFATLTEAGIDLARAAGATHAAGIRDRFLSKLSPEERATLAAVWTRLIDGDGCDGDGSPSSGCLMEGELGMAACSHIGEIREVTPSAQGCEDCLEIGASWVHLRECLICGHVGCCDSSPNRHASKHFRATGHPIVQSFEPGEDWMWCYADEVFIEPGDVARAR